MKKVRVITGLTIDEVAVPQQDQVLWLANRPLMRFTDNPELGVIPKEVDLIVDRIATPIKHYVEGKVNFELPAHLQEYKDFYIAVSPKLDPILDKYLSVLGDEIRNFENRCNFFREEKNYLEDMLHSARSENSGLETNLRTIQSASLWQRIKWVFTGVKV